MEKPIIPTRVPLPKMGGTGPKVQISKYPTIKKNMDNGAESVNGTRGARPTVAAPERTGPPNMIKVKMNGSQSVVIDRPTIAPRAVPGRVTPSAPRGAAVPQNDADTGLPDFTIEHADLMIRLLGEHYKRLTETEGDPSPADAAEATLTEECAQALAVIVAQLPPPAPPPPPRGVSPVIAQTQRLIASSPRASMNGLAPKRTPRTPLPSSGHVPDDLATAMQPVETDLADGEDAAETNGVSHDGEPGETDLA